MPYIPLARRAVLDAGEDFAADVGELNYQLTKTVLDYLHRRPRKYEAFNGVIGALEACKQELYRRAVAPYEDEKKIFAGDVYS